MKKLPAFQFYPGDWMKDPNLRRCTHAAKGLWIDLLCLMFESEERGVLVSSRRAWSDDEIALAVGGDNATVLACIQELTFKGVALRRKDGALYSKRMIRDEKTRAQNIENGRKGGNPNLMKTVKQGVNPPVKPKPTPSSSSSFSSSKEEINKEPSSSPDKPGGLTEALAYAQDRAGYDPRPPPRRRPRQMQDDRVLRSRVLRSHRALHLVPPHHPLGRQHPRRRSPRPHALGCGEPSPRRLAEFSEILTV